MGSLSPIHWIVVLLIVVLIFGTGKLKNIGKDLGSGIKGFKDGLKEGQDETKQLDNQNGQTLEVASKEKNEAK